LDPNLLYFTSNYVNADISSAVPDGSGTFVLSPGARTPVGLAIDSTWVYWASTEDGEILRAGKTTGPTQIIASDQSTPNKVATDGYTVFWTNAGTSQNNFTNGSVMKMSLADRKPIALASNLVWPVSLVRDKSTLYWASTGTSQNKHAD